VTVFVITAAGFLSVRVLRERELRSQLKDATGLYEHTVDSILDAIIATDSQQKITLFNPSAERMFGYSANEVIGQPLAMLLPERFRHQHGSHMRDFSHQDEKFRMMGAHLGIFGLRQDGQEFPIESTISRTEVGGQTQLTAVLRDVTDRRQAERELRDMNAQLRGLSSSLQDVREQERGRIARELHDELGQQLTGLKLELSWLTNRIKEGRDVTVDKLDGMRAAVDQAISSVRQIATDLRPVVLDDLGFSEALAWLGDDFTQRTGTPVHLTLASRGQAIHGDLATALFRIVQESLTNVTRYACAKNVTISLGIVADDLLLRVSDDGVGLPHPLPTKGFGWVSMRERANALGGRFTVKNNAEGGVTVEVSIPLDLPMMKEGQDHEV
jgi:PAS domain S-box-containing protein